MRVIFKIITIFSLLIASASLVAERPLKIGVLAFRPKAQALASWQPLAEYLTLKMGRQVELETYSYLELETAITYQQIDVVLTNPANYVVLRYHNGLSVPLATQVNDVEGFAVKAFGGVIFTRSENQSIQTLADLSDKKIAVSKIESLGGYKMQAYEMWDAGLNLPATDKLYLTGMPHDKVVSAVLQGEAEAGFVRTGVLEALAKENKLDLSQIRIVNTQSLSAFPYKLSTRLYPEWPIAVMPHVKEQQAKVLALALLALKPDDVAAKTASIQGFTIPESYAGVEQLLRTMRVKPFNTLPDITAGDIWDKYKQSIILIALLFIVLLILGLLLSIKNKRLRDAKNKISESEWQLNRVIHASGLGYWDWNYKTGEYVVNVEWLEMLGLKEKSILSIDDAINLIHPKEKGNIQRSLEESVRLQRPFEGEFRMRHTCGDWIWIQGSGSVVESDIHGDVVRICGIYQNVSERKKADEKIKLISRVFTDTHEGVLITDSKGLVVDVNPAFCEITGYQRQEVLGKSPSILRSGKQTKEFYQDMWSQIEANGYWQGEIWNRKKTGELYAELLTISSLFNDEAEVVNYIGLFTDITENKKQQEKLSQMAHYDLLTGLPNRVLFVDRFKQAIAHSNRSGCKLAVCYLDLDNFKPVNDNYGHAAGDSLLIDVAERIAASIREGDTVSRQGGDEFALLINDVHTNAHCEEAVQRVINALESPCVIEGVEHEITASIGVAIYPDDDNDIDTLVRHADNAMYQAKLSGKNRYYIFDHQQDKAVIDKNQRLKRIQQALESKELCLFFQPKVDMSNGDVFGAEALIRWRHPEKGLLPPIEFLPLIESTELEVKLGDWVIEQALQYMHQWVARGVNLEVSVNIASNHLQSKGFEAKLRAALERHPSVKSKDFQLEILESSALSDLHSISDIIHSCQRQLGVSIALDDFGTGYSSLAHLRRLSANTIKIDQSFIRDMLDDMDDYKIVDGMIGLAEAFDCDVIAEGVETIEHGLMLLMLKCSRIQGYCVAKPMPAEKLLSWINNYTICEQWKSFDSSQWTDKEFYLQLFNIIARHCKASVLTQLDDNTLNSRVQEACSKRQDGCEQWLKKVEKEALFDEDSLLVLRHSQSAFFVECSNVMTSCTQGSIEKSEAEARVEQVFYYLQRAIEQCD